MATFPVVTGDQRAILAASILIIAIPVVAVFLQLLSRRIAKRAFNTKIQSVSASLSSLSITGVIRCGLGYNHMANIIENYGLEPITSLLKISILLLYRKLFPTPFIHRANFPTTVLIGAWAIATILAGCLICRPISKNWDLLMTDGYCGNQVLSFTVTGAINLVTDIMVLVLPLPNLYKLQVPIQQRAVLVGVFSLGFLTCAVSAVRIHYLSSMDYIDLTFSMKHPTIFSGLEPSAAITLACIPLLRPLFRWSGGYSHTGTALGAKQVSPFSPKSSENSQRGKGNLEDTHGITLGRFKSKGNDDNDDSSECRLRPEEEQFKHSAVATGDPPHSSYGSNGGRSMMIAESFIENKDGNLEEQKRGQHRSDTQHYRNKTGSVMRQEWDVTKQ